MTSPTVDLLQTLIRNTCVNDGMPNSGHEHRSVASIADFLGAQGELFEPVPGRQSVVYRIAGTDPEAPALMLMGHTDVVPVNPEGWSVDPFAGEIADGFVWGRGAIDMLNLTASMTVVFRRYLSGELDPLPGDLVFLAVADEENSGTHGARPLVRDRWDLVHCDYLLTEIAYPPITTASGIGYPVNVAEKGPHWTRLTSHGTPGHGSVPYGADNAIGPMVQALAGVFETPAPIVITDIWREFVDTLGFSPARRDALLDPDRVDTEIDALAAEDPRFAAYVHACTHLTVSPNVFEGGIKANVVPEHAEAQIDLRALPGQTRDDVDQYLRKAMGSAGDRIELHPVADHEASASAPGNPLWDTIVDSIEDHTGTRRVVPTITPAATDARFFRSRGTTAYGVGLFDESIAFPDFLSMFHGHNERVSIRSLDLTTALLETILQRWGERSAS
jgi:acetylornithine deacetylase/succinyl-diaminopimelate desuccinylase-like protein